MLTKRKGTVKKVSKRCQIPFPRHNSEKGVGVLSEELSVLTLS
ncbi:hypothetical protein Daudx_1232 [Candidatus Desulforudis audaxviator]|nr:hypothetical protein Daudx_1232 [Candidatus Desulforudis audaxviator]